MGQNHCHQGLGRDLGPDGPLPSEGHQSSLSCHWTAALAQRGTGGHDTTQLNSGTSAVSSLRSVRKAPVFFYGLFGPPVGF